MYPVASSVRVGYTHSMTTEQNIFADQADKDAELARLTRMRDMAWAKAFRAANVHTTTGAENEARDRRAAHWNRLVDLTQAAIDKL